MPQRPNIVCAKTCGPDMFVFDCTKQEERYDYPDLRLTGSWDIVYGRSGLAWNPITEGYILSSNQELIYLWDVYSERQHNKKLDPEYVYKLKVIFREFKNIVSYDEFIDTTLCC